MRFSLTRTRLRVVSALLTATALIPLAACGGESTAGQADAGATLDVVASFYALQFVAEQVGGDAVSVTSLTKPGAEPHDLELAPQDLAELSESDLAIYLSGFQPAVDDAIATTPGGATLDVTAAADLSLTDTDGATDPHFWLDPMRLADVADAVADQLAELSPDAASMFQQNAAHLRKQLTALDHQYAKQLEQCDSRLLVTSHAAFGYLADAYRLDQVGLTGLTPETEPAPNELADVTDLVRDNHVKTVFYETLVSPDVAETVASATGASTSVLDPIEGITDESEGADYLQVMAANLSNLREGLSCQ
jgi:zinc transport system substrate-binding protein